MLLVVSRLPRITCIMKAELCDNILLGGGARLARYIRNDSPRSMVKLAVEEIGRGSQLVVFPEGTRAVRLPVNRFKPGFAMIARRAGADRLHRDEFALPRQRLAVVLEPHLPLKQYDEGNYRRRDFVRACPKNGRR